MLESTYIGDGWDIIEYTDTYPYHVKQKSYYSRHHCARPGERAWMMVTTTTCHHCKDAVPDHIQALMVLITWGKYNET